jgi:hypothetical protein
MICIAHRTLFRLWNQQGCDGGGGAYGIYEEGEISKGFCWVNMKEAEHVEGFGVDGSIMLKCILEVESKGTD